MVVGCRDGNMDLCSRWQKPMHHHCPCPIMGMANFTSLGGHRKTINWPSETKTVLLCLYVHVCTTLTPSKAKSLSLRHLTQAPASSLHSLQMLLTERQSDTKQISSPPATYS